MFMIFLWSFVLTSLIRSDIFNSMEEIKTIRELIMPKKIWLCNSEEPIFWLENF